MSSRLRPHAPHVRVLHARVALVVFGALAVLAADPADARKLLIRKPASSELRESAERRAASGVPRDAAARRERGGLEIGGPPRSVFTRRALERRPNMLRAAGPDTLVVKVAALRIEFATDRLGDLTTGDGKMMRENPDTVGIFIDPAPHSEAYFQKHLEALDRYWSSMTYGRLRIEGTVFPRDQEFGAYELTDMADYGPTSDQELFSIEGLTRYSRESLLAADADTGLVWSDYDIFFVMHAGADWQNDVIGNSRYDLPTFSITFSDSDLVVTDTSDTLETMITFPETSSQDGFLVALNGVIAHEMGHQFGLFDIYNVETFAPTVAFYDLMDSGNLASVFVPNPRDTTRIEEVIGVLPTAVGAWSRWLVTFQFGIEPSVIKQDTRQLRLRAIQSRSGEGALPPGTYKWVQLPISETEYFLVENRVDDLDGRDASGNYLTALDQDDATGVVLGPIHAETDEVSHNYDLLLDPGVLIWHIDERQALANFSRGRGLNVIFEKRSVTIEEADGLIDIGSPFSPFPLGTDQETFHADNNANFTPFTRPNSHSNLRTPSNISIRDISSRDTTVTMNISFGTKPAGWPMEVGRYGSSGLTATTAADTDGDGRLEIAVSADTSVFLFKYEDEDGDGDVDPAGAWPAPLADMRLFGRPSYAQSIGNLDSDDELEIVAVTDSGSVYCWNSVGTPFGSATPEGEILSFGPVAGPSWSALPADLDRDGIDELYLTTLDARLRGYDLSGGSAVERFPPRRLLGDTAVDTLFTTVAIGDLNADGRHEGLVAYARGDSVIIQEFDREGRRLPPLSFFAGGVERERVWIGIADLDRTGGDNGPEIVLATQGGWIASVDREGGIENGWPIRVNGPIEGPPAFGDLDGDGLLEIAISEGASILHALNYNGTEMPGWPVRADMADFPGAHLAPSGPAIADVDGDGGMDVVVGFVDFTVRAFARDGSLVEGFPVVAGGPVRSTPAILDANGDGRLDLMFQAQDGHAYVHMLGGVASRTNPAWPMFAGDARLWGSFDDRRLPTPGPSGLDVLAGPVVVFPNPVPRNQDEITIRYTLGANLDSATDVEVKLYNLAGEVVMTLDGPTAPNTENVLRVPSGKFASGVYFCSVTARSGARVQDHLGKFAVIR